MQNNVVPAILTLAPGSGAGTMNGQQIAQPVLPGAAAPMDFAALMQTQPATGAAAGAASGPTPVGLPPVSPDTLVGEGGEAAELSPEDLAALAATTGAAAGNISGVIATKSGPVALSDFAEGDEDPDLLAALQAEEVTTPAATLATAQQMKERQSLRPPTVKPAEAGTSTEGAAAALLRNAEMVTTADGQQVAADSDAAVQVAATAAALKGTQPAETAHPATTPVMVAKPAGETAQTAMAQPTLNQSALAQPAPQPDAPVEPSAQRSQLLNSTAPAPQAPAVSAEATTEPKPTLAQMAPYSMTQIDAPTTKGTQTAATQPAGTVAELETALKAEVVAQSTTTAKEPTKGADPATASMLKAVAGTTTEAVKTTTGRAPAAPAVTDVPVETVKADGTAKPASQLPNAQPGNTTQPLAANLNQPQTTAAPQASSANTAQPLPGQPLSGQAPVMQGQTADAAQQQAAPQSEVPVAAKAEYDTTKVQPDLKAELTAEMKPGVAQMSPAQAAAQPAAVAPQQAMMAGAEASAQTQATQALAQSNVTAQAEAAQPQTATSQGAPMTRSLMMTDREWPTQLTAMVKEARDLTQGDIEIALQPERLGKMTIRMEMRDNAVAVTIVTDNDSSARLLNDNQARLADLMKQAGLDLTQHNASSGQQGREQAGLGGQAGGNPGGHGQSSDTNQPATAQILGGDAGTMNPAAEDDGIDILA
ncbi:flagellar hook-length control protein FliK [Thalassovita sp.]|uniref:flagellar hook-length control protein FliK n=1 Tax=Thalassovita sp. TaxID=1979401 RepID=UPI002AAF8DEF|nr:flagellar hook-length control protein FliK [Thalassovita sp.]